MKQPTHAEIRIDFINQCLIKPIAEAGKENKEFKLSDTFVGRSLFIILVDNGLISDHVDFTKEFYDKAESEVVGVADNIDSKPATGKLSLKAMMNKAITPERTVTEEQREETILLAYFYMASQWLENARKEGLDLQEVLKLN